MKIKKKIISGLLTATTLVSLCAFSAGAVSTDKKFSIEDATLIQKNVVGMTTFDEKQIKLYDLNKDGVITVVDSTLVQKIIVGLIKEPTEEQFAYIRELAKTLEVDYNFLFYDSHCSLDSKTF